MLHLVPLVLKSFPGFESCGQQMNKSERSNYIFERRLFYHFSIVCFANSWEAEQTRLVEIQRNVLLWANHPVSVCKPFTELHRVGDFAGFEWMEGNINNRPTAHFSFCAKVRVCYRKDRAALRRREHCGAFLSTETWCSNVCACHWEEKERHMAPRALTWFSKPRKRANWACWDPARQTPAQVYCSAGSTKRLLQISCLIIFVFGV